MDAERSEKGAEDASTVFAQRRGDPYFASYNGACAHLRGGAVSRLSYATAIYDLMFGVRCESGPN